MFPKNGRTWSYKEEMKHFVQCILEGSPFRSPASDAAVDVRYCEDVYREFVRLRAS